MTQSATSISVSTRGQGLYEITAQVVDWVRSLALKSGLLTVYVQHTSASLTIQENADPDVIRDLRDFFRRLAPEDDPHYRHTIEGPDDMPAHIKAALTATSISIPIVNSAPALGTWQGIYLFEHRSIPHRRTVICHAIGER
jgi:secondary thiamine-phosphate synthase enzyme